MTHASDQSSRANTGFIDPLLDCLVTLTQIFERPKSHEALKAGLPLVNNCFTPRLFLQAAEKAGLSARIIKRPLEQISDLVLPTVLLLKNNQACILTKLYQDNTADVIFPETGKGETHINIEKLTENYTGYAIFIQPIQKFEGRADEYQLEKPTSWFWHTLWRFRRNYYNVAIAAIMINIFAIASPLFVMNVYDRVVPNNAFTTLWVLATGITIVFLFDFLLKTLRGYLIDISGKKADILLSNMMYRQVMGLRMEAKPVSTGAFANNLQGFEAVRDFFTSATIASLIDLPFILLFIWVIWLIGGAIAIVPLVTVPIVIIVALSFEIPMRKAVEKTFIGASQKQALLVESINGMEMIKALSAEGDGQKKWEQYVSMTAKYGLQSRLFSSLAVNFSGFALQMVTVLVVVVGVYLFSVGEISLGGLIACVILSGRALAPLTQVASLITRYQQAKMGLETLNRIMDLPIERPHTTQFVHRAQHKGEIEFNNVSFQYPKQEIKALDNVSFKIDAGEKVAILGKIGSGKSTILKLILGLYQTTEGSIHIDETDLKQLDPADIRKNIGYAAQDNLLFYGTVKENIIKSAPWANDEAILKAAKIAGVDQFTSRHPAGFDMPIGENSTGISGGQSQAVGIARALLPNPPILLLDEPSSSMDNTAEVELIQRLKVETQDKTVVLVTHKAPLLHLVDRLIIVDSGKVVADGPKEKVLAMLSQNTAVSQSAEENTEQQANQETAESKIEKKTNDKAENESETKSKNNAPKKSKTEDDE